VKDGNFKIKSLESLLSGEDLVSNFKGHHGCCILQEEEDKFAVKTNFIVAYIYS
jgi:hypothetical protein